jgi:hypothetical protein
MRVPGKGGANLPAGKTLSELLSFLNQAEKSLTSIAFPFSSAILQNQRLPLALRAKTVTFCNSTILIPLVINLGIAIEEQIIEQLVERTEMVIPDSLNQRTCIDLFNLDYQKQNMTFDKLDNQMKNLISGRGVRVKQGSENILNLSREQI